ncbi:MAG TPA: pyridoxal phosphate-dependent aminotransferase [Bryobacteraceae bacterium]|nr:pyridoxal phosphate-dependent aminotransferase [Bryobacteraceae bacterium]
MRFSSRLRWALQPNPLSGLLAAKRAAGSRILDLTESNPTRAELDYPAAEILSALSDERALLYEPDPTGWRVARQAVAGYYAERGHTIEPERILLTASTSEAYGYVFKLLTEPGEEILAPQPSYPLFEFLAGMELLQIRPYPLLYDEGWRVDLDVLEQTIGPRTRAIVVVNPNNPTGSYLKRGELARLEELCAERDLALVADEVFADYALAGDADRAETLANTERALTFSLSGLSKVVALPQMKLGWLVVSGPKQIAQQAMERLELIADTYLSVGTPVQVALPGLLALRHTMAEQIRRRLRANLNFLRERAAGSACRVLRMEGGWYAILQVPRTRTEEAWVLELLDQDDVLVQPGFFYDFETEAFLVLSLLTPPAIFKEGVERIIFRTGG